MNMKLCIAAVTDTSMFIRLHFFCENWHEMFYIKHRAFITVGDMQSYVYEQLLFFIKMKACELSF